MTYARRGGFTLIELLVVIAIIIVLAFLGFSFAGKMFATAKAAKCSNHLRQIGPIIHTLKDEGIDNGWNSSGYFPPYAGQISAPSPFRNFNIYELIGEQAGLCEFDKGVYKWKEHPSRTFLQNPLSRHKLGGDQKVDQIINRTFDSHGGFGYNTLIEGWVSVNTAESKVKQTTIHKIKFPELTIIMAEQNPNHGNVPVWMGPWNNVTPAGTYKNGAHCLFVDGHVEHLKNDYLASSEGKRKHLYLDAGF